MGAYTLKLLDELCLLTGLPAQDRYMIVTATYTPYRQARCESRTCTNRGANVAECLSARIETRCRPNSDSWTSMHGALC